MASSSQNANTKVIVIALSILAILISLMTIINILNRIPDNDPNLIGNSAGNLNNNGLFCESDGRVYFSNAYDSGSLYSMNPDQTDIKKLYEGNCRYINAGGDYLYFGMSSSDGGTGLGYVLKTSGIYRAKKSGHKISAINEEASLVILLYGNKLFYQAATGEGVGLKVLDITDSTPRADIIENTYVLNPACVENGNIYYGGTEKEHYLYSMNTESYSSSAIWGGDVWNPVYEGGYFYYMDISNDYCICRYSPSTQTVDILSHDRADTFNVGYGYIYYSTSVSDNPGLYRMHEDGSANELVMSGTISDINMTDTYTYFHRYGASAPMYCVSTTGVNAPYEFTAAQSAVTK